jgi:ABC-type Fe3+ transport system substrate-binding protein
MRPERVDADSIAAVPPMAQVTAGVVEGGLDHPDPDANDSAASAAGAAGSSRLPERRSGARARGSTATANGAKVRGQRSINRSREVWMATQNWHSNSVHGRDRDVGPAGPRSRPEAFPARAIPLATALVAVALTGSAAAHEPQDAGFENSYEAIVAAAANEPALHFCQTFSREEWDGFIAGFEKMFPDIAKIETSECNGTSPRERVIVEWQAGRYDVDLMNIGSDFMERMDEQDIGAVPDWSVFDGTPLQISPIDIAFNGRVVGVGSSTNAIVYNPQFISREDVPKSFKECADPKYKGQFMVDIRPGTRFALMPHFLGDEGTAEWARGIAANEPLWARSSAPMTVALLQGERPFICGVQVHGPLRGFVKAAPGGKWSDDSPLEFVVPTDHTNSPGYVSPVIAKYPNAPNTALLLVAYAASNPEAIDAVNPGYGSPSVKGSWKAQYFENAGIEPNWPPEGAWAVAEYAERAANIILEAWGHPKAVVKRN